MKTKYDIGDLVYYDGTGDNTNIDYGIIIDIHGEYKAYTIKWFIGKDITHEHLDTITNIIKKLS